MDADPADRLERLFRAARLVPPSERDAFLAAACPDAPLRDELAALLAADADADADDFLGAPAGLPVPQDAFGNDLSGRQIGMYLVQRRLGGGGMGDVYLALRLEPFKRYVALKVVRPEMNSREVLQRFEMERQILASLDHPGIAKLLDGGRTEEGWPFLVMEFVDGRPVTDYCDALRMPVEERLRLFVRVCRAVHAAHQNLVLHRDLKPSNVLVTVHGAPKLLDFGIAKLLNPNFSSAIAPVTRTDVRIMTPEYASPEQVRGELLSTASDVYSLGVLLYELLTGARPYRLAGRSTAEVLRIVSEEEPEPPSAMVLRMERAPPPGGSERSDAPADVGAARASTPERLAQRFRPELDAVVLKALRREPGRRYASAEALAEDLERHLAGLPVEALRGSRAYRIHTFVRRHRTAVATAVAAAVVLVAFSIYSSTQARVVARERDRTEQALAEAEAVTNFLIRLFEASDPAERGGVEVTAGELLARGVARAEELVDQPLVQAQMLDVIGRVYERLGQYGPAHRLVEEAMLLRQEHLGDDHLLVAESRVHVAQALTHRGAYDEAVALLETALAMQRARLGDAHPDLAATLLALGYLLPFQARLTEAETTYREVVGMQRRLHGESHPLVAEAMIPLGAVLRSQGRYAEAEAVFREALAMHRRLLGEHHPDVAFNLFQLALVLEHQGRFADAEPLLRRALEVQRAATGESHPALTTYMFSLGETLEALGRGEEAEPLYREGLALRRRLLGEHPATADALLAVAAFQQKQGALEKAEALHREALALRQRLYGAEHQEVGVALTYLGRTLVELGRYAEAEVLFRQALAMHRRVNGTDHHHVAGALTALARLHRRLGRLEEAVTLYEDGLEILRKNHSEEHAAVLEVRAELASLYEEIGRGGMLTTSGDGGG